MHPAWIYGQIATNLPFRVPSLRLRLKKFQNPKRDYNFARFRLDSFNAHRRTVTHSPTSLTLQLPRSRITVQSIPSNHVEPGTGGAPPATWRARKLELDSGPRRLGLRAGGAGGHACPGRRRVRLSSVKPDSEGCRRWTCMSDP